VALCNLGVSQVYVVLGERRAGDQGQPAWLVRSYFNPWVQLIYLGPLLMALGGLISLSDRRLRFAVGRKP
jgi:cytochrome c-type biogenesis protein CcmF